MAQGLNRNITCPACGSTHVRLDAIFAAAPYAGKLHAVMLDFDTDERPYRHTHRTDQEAGRDTSTGVLVQCVCGRCVKPFSIALRTHLDGLQLFVSSD